MSLLNDLWWSYMPGQCITVHYPRGPVTIPAGGGGFIQLDSGDPNDHYRPWLEQHVGRQGWDWDWRLTYIGSSNYSPENTLEIKFRKAKVKYASYFLLKYRDKS